MAANKAVFESSQKLSIQTDPGPEAAILGFEKLSRLLRVLAIWGGRFGLVVSIPFCIVPRPLAG
jgi:hypothetical protein